MHTFVVENVEPVVDAYYKTKDEELVSLIPSIIGFSFKGKRGRDFFPAFFDFMGHAQAANHAKARAFVYAYDFKEDGGSLIKVGYSANPNERLGALKTEAKRDYKAEYTKPIFLIPVISETKAEYLENEIHSSLPKDDRKSGKSDWYEGWFGTQKRLNLWYILSYHLGVKP